MGHGPLFMTKQARKDHEYLWHRYGPDEDLTGGYQDLFDLHKLLKYPSKAHALVTST